MRQYNPAKFTGFFDEAVQFVEKAQLLRTDLWKRFVKQYKEEDADAEGGWRGEYWGKMMRGACFVYSYSRNPKLYEVLKDTITDMLSAQDEMGRISTYAVDHEFEAWDLWCRKYVLLGMQYFLEICEEEDLKEKIIKSMCAQVDYIMTKVGEPSEGKILITRATRHWRGLNSSSILEPIVRLYNLTKEERYFEFASYIVKQGGTEIANIFDLAYENKLYPYQYPVTKGYEMTSCFEGLLEYYYVTGNERYKQSIINFANKVLESDFTIIGCSGCTHELFDHSTVRQANTNINDVMQETCVTVTLMKFFYRVALLTGDAKYIDAFETSFYNAYLGSLNTEQIIETEITIKHPDWCAEAMPFNSYSPLTAGPRGNKIGGLKVMSDGHYYGCCACIGSIGMGLVPKAAFYATEDGFKVNLYFNGKVEGVTPNGQKLTLHTKTNYPADGEILITTVLEEKESFKLEVRIPAWSKKTSLFVNEEAASVTEGYVVLDREWADGDSIALNLDMRTEALYPIPYGHQVLMNHVIWGANYVVPTYDEEDPIAKNHIALRRGPIILAQENRLGYSVDEPIDVYVDEDGYVAAELTESKIAPYSNLLEVEVPLKNGNKMHVTDYASAGRLWNEESKMAAWMLTIIND